jgi:hypothetical protein
MTPCAHCGSSLADDQLYCLECGGRQVVARSPFLDRFTPARPPAAAYPSGLPGTQGSAGGAVGRSPGVTAFAGLGVLLLAMGVGVLIGRSAAGRTTTLPAQVITVGAGAAGAAGVGTPLASEATGAGAAGSPSRGASPSSRGALPSSRGSSPSSSRGSSSSGAGGGAKSQTAAPKSKTPSSGESYEQKSRNLPNVVTTG